MQRIHEENVNTPEFFDKIWESGVYNKFDTVRMRALCKRIETHFAICELGSGIFGFAEYAAQEKLCSDITVVDFSTVALRKTNERYPDIVTKNANVLVTGFYDNVFDLVGAGELIEHMEKPEALVAEMNRICKPGGWLVISTVNPDCPNAKKLEYPEHIYSFTVEDLINYFKPYGETEYIEVGDYHTIETKTWL